MGKIDWRIFAWLSVALIVMSIASATQKEATQREITKRKAMELGYEEAGWDRWVKKVKEEVIEVKGLEISILKEDNEIYDLEGDACDKYEDEFRFEFEKSSIGKTLLSQGYKCVHRDFDDNTLQLYYRKEDK